jgi:hypothetical protein
VTFETLPNGEGKDAGDIINGLQWA